MIKTMTANQKMAELFQRDKSTISRHIFYVFESGEPKQDPCSAKFAIRQFLQPRRKRLLKFGSRLLLPGGKRTHRPRQRRLPEKEIRMPSGTIRMRDEEPVRDIFQKTIVRQPFTLELYAQVHLLIATCARSCSENYRSSHLESRFGRTLRSQVFQTLTKARVYMTIISDFNGTAYQKEHLSLKIRRKIRHILREISFKAHPKRPSCQICNPAGPAASTEKADRRRNNRDLFWQKMSNSIMNQQIERADKRAHNL